jgi:hypothetical protein
VRTSGLVASVGLLAAAVAAGPGCRERAAALLSFDAGARSVPPPPPAEEPRQVHFSITGPNAVTFNWRGSEPTLRLWSKDVPPRVLRARPPSPEPISSPGPWHEAVADGLLPGVEYFYEVGHPLRPQTQTFRAPPSPGASGFTVVAVGDIGTSKAAAAVHRLISLREPAFVLALGDLTYADERSQADVDRHFDDVMVWSRRSAYMPVWGNHEWGGGKKDDLRNYKGRFALPNAAASPGAPAAGCCGEDWYWFDHGAVRFIVYPEPYHEDTWPDWARAAAPVFAAAESNPAVTFVVTAGHRPAYTSGHHGGEPELRAILDGFGKRFPKYVLNLAGHTHAYERSKPQAHVVHIAAGIGGGPLEHAPTECLWTECKPPPFIAFRAIHHGFVKLAVSSSAIAIEAICGSPSPGNDTPRCGTGQVLDQTTITAGSR